MQCFGIRIPQRNRPIVQQPEINAKKLEEDVGKFIENVAEGNLATLLKNVSKDKLVPLLEMECREIERDRFVQLLTDMAKATVSENGLAKEIKISSDYGQIKIIQQRVYGEICLASCIGETQFTTGGFATIDSLQLFLQVELDMNGVWAT